MQANQTPVIWTVIIVAVLLGICGLFMVSSINKNVTKTIGGIDVVDEEALANAIIGGIVIPEMPELADNAKVDRVCELTNGCEFWEAEGGALHTILNNRCDIYDYHDNDFTDDLQEEIADLIGLDWDRHGHDSEVEFDEIEFYEDDNGISYQIKVDTKDYPLYQVNNDWEVTYLLRVEYVDVDDEEETEVIYVLMTTTLDEGDYDNSLSVEEVTRQFEFD